MPLFQYFGWVGSLLLVALFATDWCCSAPIARNSEADVPFDQKVHIRIHTDHKWPERVVLDTTRSTPTRNSKADGETDGDTSETAMLAEPPPFEAFAEMAPSPGPCFRPPCSAQDAELDPSPIEIGEPSKVVRRSMIARKSFISPNPLHKLPGRS
jgi:hypothetical protein